MALQLSHQSRWFEDIPVGLRDSMVAIGARLATDRPEAHVGVRSSRINARSRNKPGCGV
jgi:hypothetical protein